MKLGELCAGYGGLGMAVEEVFGAELAWVSEYDEAPSKILAHHWPDIPNHGDMTKIDWAAIEPVDIISGGTPCQDLSAAGKRKGMTEGTRSNLWVQMREAIATQRPRYVVWENVRGAYSAEAASDLEHCSGCMGETADRGTVLRALGRVLGDLSDLGYDCQWRGLRAADVGACHGRFRVFVLAEDANVAARCERWISAPGQAQGGRTWADTRGRDRTSTPNASSVRSERWGVHGDLAGEAGTGQADRSKRERHGNAAYRGEPAHSGVAGDSTTTDASSARARLHAGACGQARKQAGTRGATLVSPGDGPTTPEGYRASRGEPTNWGDYAPAIARWESAMGRRAPAPTEPTGRNGGHRLSPRFTEWMMGLPDGWVTDPAIGISRNDQLKACGNGVVPQQAVAALQDMLAAFQKQQAAA